MFIFNITNPLTLILAIVVIGLLIFLGQEVKKSMIVAIPLLASLALLIVHVIQIATLKAEYMNFAGTLYRCIALDFVFILVTFFAYLWVDDIEAKEKGKKSISNCLDWFWKKI